MEIRLFGRFEVYEEGLRQALPPSAPAQALLAFLCLNADKIQTRSALAALLRPEASEQSARRILNQALWHIRRSFPGILDCTPEEISLARPAALNIDTVQFRNLVRPYLSGEIDSTHMVQKLTEAVELYRGDLLEGYYEDWIFLERESLRENCISVLTRLVQLHKASNQYEQAFNLAVHLTRIDPLGENAHREVMRLYHLLGHPRAALHHFASLKSLLQDEMNLEPEPETVELADEISKRTPLAIQAYLPEPALQPGESPLEKETTVELPMIGRRLEKAHLLSMLEPVFQRKTAFIVLSGEAGIGKTRMTREIQAELAWRGAQVIYAKSSQAEAGFGNNTLLQAIRAGLSPLRIEQIKSLAGPQEALLLGLTLRLLLDTSPEQKGLPSESGLENRPVYLQGLLLLFKLWVQVTPLVLILDDLHWANEDTWELMTDLLGRHLSENQGGLAVLASMRTEEANEQTYIEPALDKLAGRILVNRLELHPMDHETSGELIRRYLGIHQPYPLFEDILYRETGGNPLFIVESLRLMYHQSRLKRDAHGDWKVDLSVGSNQGGLLPVPAAVQSILTGRIARLSETARQILQRMAVLGDSSDYSILQAYCRIPPADLLAGLGELIKHHLVMEKDQGYVFRHDKLREAAYALPAGPELVHLHAQAAQVLEAGSSDQVEAVAYHFHQGNMPRKAFMYYEIAGRTAQKAHNNHQAMNLFTKALDLAPLAGCTPGDELQLRFYQESVLDILGKRQEQKRSLQKMEALIQKHAMGASAYLRLQFRRANWLYQTGQYSAAETTGRQAYELAQNSADRHAMAKALDAIGSAYHGAGKDSQAVPYLESAIPLFQAEGDHHSESKTWQTLAVIYVDSCRYDLAMQAVSTSTGLNRRINNQSALAMDLFLTSHVYLCLRDLVLAERYCAEAVAQSQATGNRLMEAAALSVKTNILRQQGAIEGALDAGQQTVRICQSLGEAKLQVSVLHDLISILIQEVGDLGSAEKYLRAGFLLVKKHGLERELGLCLGYEGWIEIEKGSLARARRLLKKALSLIGTHDNPECEFWLCCLYARVELAAHRPAASLASLEIAAGLVHRLSLANLEPDMLVIRTSALLDLGHNSEALQVASQAVALVQAGLSSNYAAQFAHYRALLACGELNTAMNALTRALSGMSQVLASLSPDRQRTSRENVSLHRQILQAWENMKPRQVQVRLPRRGLPGVAPGGREIGVTWTVWMAADNQIQDNVARRRRQIQRLLDEAASQGAVPVQHALAMALGVSLRTIALDLRAMKQADPPLS